MIWKRLWIVLSLLVLAAAGYWVYLRWTAPVRSVWELIPSDAQIVLESTVLQDTVSEQARLSQMPLRYTPVFQEAIQAVDQFIWSPLDSADAHRFLHRRPIWYSLHKTAKDKLEFLFYMPLRNSADRAVVERLLTPEATRFRVLSHPYEGERIYELLTVRNQSLGSFLITSDFLIGSPSTLLVESVVRRVHQPFAETPLQRADVTLSRANSIAGMYIRSSVLESLLASTDSSNTDWQSRYIRTFLPTEIKTQFRASADHTHLLGTSREDIGTQTAIAHLFAGQTPSRIGCGSLIPESTSSLFHIGLSDGSRFGDALTPFINAETDPRVTQVRRKLRPILQRSPSSFYEQVGSEVALIRLDAPASERRTVMLVRAKNAEKLFDRYQLAALLLSGNTSQSKVNTFLKHQITRIDSPDLPAYLFGGLFRGFPVSWVTLEGSFLVIANTQEVLQEYLQALRDERVWTSNLRQRNLLTQTLRPANFTVFTRFDRAGESITANWPLAWQRLLNHDETALENIENLVYQSSYGRTHIYSTIALGRTSRRASEAVFNRVFLQKKIDFNAPPSSSAFPIGDFTAGNGYIWTIDNINQFVQLTPEGQKYILQPIDGTLRSAVVPVNYLDNGRLQYAFTTGSSLYIADPGNGLVRLRSVRLPVGSLPTSLTPVRSHPVTTALLAAKDGSVYAFNRGSKRFERRFETTQKGEGLGMVQAFHQRQSIEVLSVQREGRIYFWDDSGRLKPGFPVDVKTDLIGPAFRESTPRSAITVISQQGELMHISDKGAVLERTQLYRPIRRGSFRLLIEEGQSDYLIVRETDTEVAFLDHKGNQLFEVRALIPGQTTIRYHILESGLRLVSVKSGIFTTLYDLTGRSIGDKPIQGLFPVTLQYSPTRNKLFVYSSTEKAVQVWSIKLR